MSVRVRYAFSAYETALPLKPDLPSTSPPASAGVRGHGCRLGPRFCGWGICHRSACSVRGLAPIETIRDIYRRSRNSYGVSCVYGQLCAARLRTSGRSIPRARGQRFAIHVAGFRVRRPERLRSASRARAASAATELARMSTRGAMSVGVIASTLVIVVSGLMPDVTARLRA